MRVEGLIQQWSDLLRAAYPHLRKSCKISEEIVLSADVYVELLGVVRRRGQCKEHLRKVSVDRCVAIGVTQVPPCNAPRPSHTIKAGQVERCQSCNKAAIVANRLY